MPRAFRDMGTPLQLQSVGRKAIARHAAQRSAGCGRRTNPSPVGAAHTLLICVIPTGSQRIRKRIRWLEWRDLVFPSGDRLSRRICSALGGTADQSAFHCLPERSEGPLPNPSRPHLQPTHRVPMSSAFRDMGTPLQLQSAGRKAIARHAAQRSAGCSRRTNPSPVGAAHTQNLPRSIGFNESRNPVRDQGVGGSKPLSPTNLFNHLNFISDA